MLNVHTYGLVHRNKGYDYITQQHTTEGFVSGVKWLKGAISPVSWAADGQDCNLKHHLLFCVLEILLKLKNSLVTFLFRVL